MDVDAPMWSKVVLVGSLALFVVAVASLFLAMVAEYAADRGSVSFFVVRGLVVPCGGIGWCSSTRTLNSIRWWRHGGDDDDTDNTDDTDDGACIGCAVHGFFIRLWIVLL